MFRRVGLSAWPTDAYYDPGRPSWLPYWIDDTVESQNKIAYALSTGAAGPAGILAAPAVAAANNPNPYKNPPAPATVQPPDMATDPTGANFNVDDQIAAQRAAQLAALQAWADQQGAATPIDNYSVGGFLNHLLQDNPNDPKPPGIPSWLILAGVGVAVFAVVSLGGRK